MNPTDFPQAFRTLGAPEGSANVAPLRIWTDGRECISCWRPTAEEAAKIAAGEPIFLRVLSGVTQPPICLEIGSPFEGDAFAEPDAATLRSLGIEP